MIEVTSPTTRGERPGDQRSTEYHRAGILYYAIVDRQLQGGEDRVYSPIGTGGRQWVCLRRTGPDGWLALEPIGLWLRFEDDRLCCRDARKPALLDYQK